jgi:sulfur relay (sulfurtransferase) complex TusBCD TusD component (DsrE family)
LTDQKIAIVLHAGSGTHEGLARALHALLYAKELTERGVETRLIFDGAGSEWAAKLLAPENDREKRLAGLLLEIQEQGVVYEICDYCSGAFHVKETLQAADAPLIGQYMNHPSIASLVVDGFQIWIL